MTKTSELPATVSSKGQVVIPGDVRKRLGLVKGSVPRFVLEADGVHCLAQDDARQSATAARFVEQRLGPTDRGFVSLATLLETVSVMESRYGADAALVSAIVADLPETASLEVQVAGAVRAAVQRYRSRGEDLHDCLLVSLAGQRSARVATFDAGAAKRLGMEVLR